jgi:putative CocE/NonD family hydrolase
MSEFLDNLIPLKGFTGDEQYAGWTPTVRAMQGMGCHVLADQRVEVAPGISLSADVFTPKKEGRFPAVVSFSAYTYETHTAGIPTGTNEIGSPPVFTDRGYCPVIVERRGMGRSDGEQVVFLDAQDVDDHVAVIAWAAAQPWCNGEVVLFGTSYYGMTQPLVAVRNPPALKAFFANEMCTDFYRHLTKFGGVPGLFFLNIWMGGNFTAEEYAKRMSPLKRALLSHVLNSRPGQAFVKRMISKNVNTMFEKFTSHTPVESVRRAYANWLFDSKTRATSTIPAGPSGELEKIEIPFVTVENLGEFNLHQYGTYDLFENATTPADQKWAILAPPSFKLPAYAWQLEAIAFFDHILRGTDNGYAAQAPVRYWVEGKEEYLPADGFPVPGSEPTRFYLDSNGRDAATHVLSSTAPNFGTVNSWAAVPYGMPVLGGLDQVANPILTYEVPVFEPQQLAGPVTASLRFSCNEIDSYIVARLGRVDNNGGYHLLSMGAISPARRAIDTARSTACEIAINTDEVQPLTPGIPVTLEFSLTPAPTQLNVGDKLRFDIASRSDLLRSDPQHGFTHFDLPVPPYFSRNTVHYGPDTYVEVSRIIATI